MKYHSIENSRKSFFWQVDGEKKVNQVPERLIHELFKINTGKFFICEFSHPLSKGVSGTTNSSGRPLVVQKKVHSGKQKSFLCCCPRRIEEKITIIRIIKQTITPYRIPDENY